MPLKNRTSSVQILASIEYYPHQFFPYSIKLFRVGTVSMFVSKLDPDNQGVLEQNELRKESINNAVNITDDR